MLGPLVKAQLVAFLTKKVRHGALLARQTRWLTSLSPWQLLESPTFVGGVQALHGSVTRIQQGAYDTLLQATGEQGRSRSHALTVDPRSADNVVCPATPHRRISQRNTTARILHTTSKIKRPPRLTGHARTSPRKSKIRNSSLSSNEQNENSKRSRVGSGDLAVTTRAVSTCAGVQGPELLFVNHRSFSRPPEFQNPARCRRGSPNPRRL